MGEGREGRAEGRTGRNDRELTRVHVEAEPMSKAGTGREGMLYGRGWDGMGRNGKG